ncbi:MAG: RNA 2',3'-cyclic phosphodiesterase [Bacteroidetes bacterium]|nr:RNA 2',3'-cyclic phosphodiesterase [Bacteroidota bacterium]MCL2303004.1 RNA 2',3'-cyclic phosphodiesterase [Lentimicrobiaceae bacterium]
MKRLFIAVDIELSNEFQTLTRQLQADLRGDDIVWVKSGLQHLTLRFLGETPDAKIEPIANILSSIANSTQCFDLQLDKMGVFGSKYAPAVLWYGFSEFSLFKKLFENLEKELLHIGFQENYGNFVPHITIGRIKKADHKKRFWETIEKRQPHFAQTIPIHRLKLIQSKLTNEGPIYKTLFDFGLKA